MSVTKTRVALLCGHRYGARLAQAMVRASDKIEFVCAAVLHPRNVYRYGGYESPIDILEGAGVPFTFFNDARELEQMRLMRGRGLHYVLVCGLRQIIPTQVLQDLADENGAKHIFSEASGYICFHPSDLPDGAGLAPVQWTLLERQSEGTVSSFFIDDVQTDGGPVISRVRFQIDANDDAGDLDRKIGAKIAESFENMLPDLEIRRITAVSQDLLAEKRRVRRQILQQERWLDFTEPAEQLELKVRAFAKPYGGAPALVNNRPMLVYQVKIERDLPRSGRIGRVHADGAEIVVECSDGFVRLLQFEFLD